MCDKIVNKARKTKDPDTLSWDEAMTHPQREKFLEAAQAEINALASKGAWKEDLKSNAATKIIPSQWVFRIKRTPDGEIKKFKGRVVPRGDLQDDNATSLTTTQSGCTCPEDTSAHKAGPTASS